MTPTPMFTSIPYSLKSLRALNVSWSTSSGLNFVGEAWFVNSMRYEFALHSASAGNSAE